MARTGQLLERPHVLVVAIAVVQAGQRIVVAHRHQLPLVLDALQRHGVEVAQRAQQRRDVANELDRRVVQPQEAHQLAVALDGRHDEGDDPLLGERLVFEIVDGALQQAQVLDEHAFVAAEQVEPPREVRVVDALQVPDFGRNPFRTPLVRVVEQAVMGRENVGALGMELRAEALEHAVGGALRVGRPVQVVGYLEDDLLVLVQVPKAHALFFLIGEIEAHLEAHQLATPVDEAVVEQVAVLRQGVRELPYVAFVNAEQVVRAEGTRIVTALQELVARDAVQVGVERHLEQAAAGLVHVEKLVRFDIRDVKRIGVVQIVVVVSHPEPLSTLRTSCERPYGTNK